MSFFTDLYHIADYHVSRVLIFVNCTPIREKMYQETTDVELPPNLNSTGKKIMNPLYSIIIIYYNFET